MATSSPVIITKRLEGKVAVITGGASGIGEATARLFRRHGAEVVIADIQDELGESVAKSLGCTFFHCDVTVEADVSGLIDFAVERHGRLDVMFNNAGIAHKPVSSILEMDVPDFERVLVVNVIGPFLGTKHAARAMITTATGGAVINTASSISLCPHPEILAYACSKHAVVGLTKNTAAELGRHGIRVNCVSPGAVPTTGMFAANFPGEAVEEVMAGERAVCCLKGVDLVADDVAAAALHLASDESRCVTGMNVVVDCGASVGYRPHHLAGDESA